MISSPPRNTSDRSLPRKWGGVEAGRGGRLAGAFLGLALALGCSGGEAEPSRARGVVARAPDAETLILDDGREVRLLGVVAPQPAQGRARAEPGHGEAQAGLAALALGRRLTLRPASPAPDRWGRLPALVFVERSEESLQARLVRSGLVRVRAEPGLGEALRALLALEAEARSAKRGVWGSPYYAVRAPEAAAASVGSYQIVEGVVVDAAQAGGTLYLNFGADWRSDFTAAVAEAARARFDVDALLALAGARVRVRGMVEERNGPIIWLSEPGQLETLD